MFVRVDDIVLHAGVAEVRLAHAQLGVAVALLCLEQQAAVGLRHHDVIVAVHVPAGLGSGREAPFGNDDAIVFDQRRRYRAGAGGCHVCTIGVDEVIRGCDLYALRKRVMRANSTAIMGNAIPMISTTINRSPSWL